MSLHSKETKDGASPAAPSGIISERGPFRYPLGWAKFGTGLVRTGGDMSQRKQTCKEALISPLSCPSNTNRYQVLYVRRVMRRSVAHQSRTRGHSIGPCVGLWSLFYSVRSTTTRAVQGRGVGMSCTVSCPALWLLLLVWPSDTMQYEVINW